MKKTIQIKLFMLLLFFPYFMLTKHVTLGQDQGLFAFKVAPALSFNRVHTDPDTAHFESDGVGVRGIIGVAYDFPIKENYYFSTGLTFMAKQISFKNNAIQLKEQHEVQYLQVPILLKLYTSEIALDTRIFFDLGFSIALKINDRVTQLEGNQLIQKLSFFQIGGVLGCYVEYNVSLVTSFFGGISYQPTLNSAFSEQAKDSNLQKLFGYSDLVCLELGIRF